MSEPFATTDPSLVAKADLTEELKNFVITTEFLEEKGACVQAIKAFKKEFPEGRALYTEIREKFPELDGRDSENYQIWLAKNVGGAVAETTTHQLAAVAGHHETAVCDNGQVAVVGVVGHAEAKGHFSTAVARRRGTARAGCRGVAKVGIGGKAAAGAGGILVFEYEVRHGIVYIYGGLAVFEVGEEHGIEPDVFYTFDGTSDKPKKYEEPVAEAENVWHKSASTNQNDPGVRLGPDSQLRPVPLRPITPGDDRGNFAELPPRRRDQGGNHPDVGD